MDDIEVTLIAAYAEDGEGNKVIGNNGEIPWYYSEDLQRFREVTMDTPVIQGRRTYENIVERLGHPLDGRKNIVLTTRDLAVPPSVTTFDNIDDALEDATRFCHDQNINQISVIGGASVYEQLINRADRLELTEVKEEYEGDTYFPDWDEERWEETSREQHQAFDFIQYRKKPEL